MSDPGADTICCALRHLQELFPGWLITADERAGLYSARRPGLRITRSAAGALETELLRWQRAPGAPDLRVIP